MNPHSSDTSSMDLSSSPTFDLNAFVQAVNRASPTVNAGNTQTEQARGKPSQRPVLWKCVSWDREFNETSEDAQHSRLFPRIVEEPPYADARRSSRVAESQYGEPESGADAPVLKSRAPKVDVAKTRVSKVKKTKRPKLSAHIKEPIPTHSARSPTPEDTIRVVPLPQAAPATPLRSSSKARRKPRA
ncbi:MAG: hypothetical protein M1812_000514 [Candelaria pacifica]|nr:MAG: hypothetical protein M1812_000514 [Candelaria pacifica]